MKVTPLLDFNIPQQLSAVTNAVIVDKTSIADDLTDSSAYSSSDDTDNSFHKKFVGLNPKKKNEILEKSNFILRTRSHSQRLLSHSDNNTSRNDQPKRRSATLPKESNTFTHFTHNIKEKSATLPKSNSTSKSVKQELNTASNNDQAIISPSNYFQDDVFLNTSIAVYTNTSDHDNTQPSTFALTNYNGAMINNVPYQYTNDAMKNTPTEMAVSDVNGSDIRHVSEVSDFTLPKGNKVPVVYSSTAFEKHETNEERASCSTAKSEIVSDLRNDEPKMPSGNDARFITLANQSAADLLGEVMWLH